MKSSKVLESRKFVISLSVFSESETTSTDENGEFVGLASVATSHKKLGRVVWSVLNFSIAFPIS